MWHWIKEHPYLTGGIALALVVLWALIRRSSSAGSGSQAQVVQTGPSDAIQALEIQAGTQLQEQQLAAQANIAGVSAAANVQGQQINAAQNLGLAQTAAALQVGLAPYGLTAPNTPFGPSEFVAGYTPNSSSPGTGGTVTTAPAVQPTPFVVSPTPSATSATAPTSFSAPSIQNPSLTGSAAAVADMGAIQQTYNFNLPTPAPGESNQDYMAQVNQLNPGIFGGSFNPQVQAESVALTTAATDEYYHSMGFPGY